MVQDTKLDVEDLHIYQISYKLMLEIHKITLSFPKIEQYGGIADRPSEATTPQMRQYRGQLRRSSKSITANITEGFGKQRFYKEEFRRMLVYAIGSCDETMLWIKASKDLGYINKNIEYKYIKEYKILVKKISTFTANLKK